MNDWSEQQYQRIGAALEKELKDNFLQETHTELEDVVFKNQKGSYSFVVDNSS